MVSISSLVTPEEYRKLTFFEYLAYKYAWNGWRGSQFLWSLCSMYGAKDLSLGSLVVLLPSGFKIQSQAKDWTKRTIYQGTYERALLHLLDSLKMNDLVIDVGANIGITLWHSLNSSNSNSTYFAFEPSTQCIDDLAFTSTQISNKGKIFKFALGETGTTQKLYGVNNKQHSGLASLIKRDNQVGDSQIVEVWKLDTVLENEKANGTVSLLKIDTEGYEGAVLLGAHKLLESKKVEIIILEVSPNLSDVTYLNNLNNLLGNQYNWFAIEETGFIRRRPTLRKISHIEATKINYQFNLAIIRADRFAAYERDCCAIKIS